MNESSASKFDSDLHISFEPVIVVLIFLGLVASIAGGSVANVEEMRLVITAFWGVSAAAWILILWKREIGLWCLIAGLVAIIQIINVGLSLPQALNLLVIPTALAVGLIGFPGAIIVGVAETLLLGLAWIFQVVGDSFATVFISAILIWTVLGVMWAISRRILAVAEWSWETHQQARTLIEEVRNQRAEREQVLADLAYANRQLVVVNEKLGAMRVMAEEAQKSTAAFVANVSHEFRTPLNMIIGLVDLLLETPDVYGDDLPPALMQDLEIVHRNCQHLANMIDDVLDLSQVEVGKLALHRERVNLTEVIDRALNLVRPLVEKKGLTLKFSLPPDLPEVYCDRTRIRQVIFNLLSNAARLTDTGGLSVRVERETDEIVIRISDTGPGIVAEDLEKVFQPFYRGMPGVVAGQTGSGLGLAISKQFVEAHGGRIWLESTFGAGSTFSFSLPISPPIPVPIKPGMYTREEWQWHERTTRPAAKSDPFRQRVVICDETRELYPIFIRYSDQVEFVDCANITDTVEQVLQSDAQAIMLNVTTPQDLFVQVEQLRQTIGDVPIIGCSVPPRSEHALRAGAQSYLFKPVLKTDLELALAQVGKPVRQVLIVDDNSDAQQLFARMLHASDETLGVRIASSGKEALEAMCVERPDVVLLDIILPDLDGWQVLAAMNQDANLRGIPTIFVSAQDPAERPQRSRMLMATMGDGISISQLLRCSQMLAASLLQPDPVRDPMPG